MSTTTDIPTTHPTTDSAIDTAVALLSDAGLLDAWGRHAPVCAGECAGGPRCVRGAASVPDAA